MFNIARLCLLGTNCDMFQYSASKCTFIPHNALKDENLFNVITRDTTSVNSLYVLQCSTPHENILKNNDLSTHSYDGNNSSKQINKCVLYYILSCSSYFASKQWLRIALETDLLFLFGYLFWAIQIL